MADSTAGLAPPGSSSYNSATMSVGDGTWDSKTNTFLLPNLEGLNFATMQYNGMGNRFSTMQGYHSLIRAHGVIAAIVFLFLVPFAIMFNRFYGREPWFALKVHIWCQILTLLLTTVVFILGNIAVGPSRALTNPHHGVGLAIYVLVLFQFISGWYTHKREKNRKKSYAPVKAVVHMWLGRVTALLGLAQVPLGLTLYGSPSYLFVLYSLVTAVLIVTYFVLSYIQERNRGLDYESELSYEEEARKTGRWGKYATAAAAGVGISALANRLRHRRGAASRHGGSSVSDEKFSQYGHRQDTQQGFSKKSILGIGALGATSYWLGGIFGKRRNKKEREDMTEYSGTNSDSMEAAEEGRHGASPGPSPAPHHALNPGSFGHRRQDSAMSEESWESDGTPSRRGAGHGLRNAAIGIGSFAFARNYFKKRKERKENARIEELRQQELEDERIQRANSRKYTGDGAPRASAPSVVSTNLAPIAGPTTAAGALAGPPPIRHVTDTGPEDDPFVSTVPLPPPPPPHSVGMSSHSYESMGTQRPPHQGHGEAIAAGAGGAAMGMAAAHAMNHRNRSSSRRRESGGTMNSPPVSVKLNMHSDGRHVTLRRLTEEEAAAERARHSRNRSRRRRAESTSSLSGNEAAYPTERYRRTPNEMRQQQENITQNNPTGLGGVQYAPTASGVPMPIPPPPPIPYTSPRPTPPHGQSSIGSRATFDESVTGGSTNYDDNRRRRRAERAAASKEKAAKANRAEFS